REGHHGEAAHHVAVDDVVIGPAPGMGPLALQDPVVIAVIGHGPFMLVVDAVAGGLGLDDQRPERARLLALLGRPVEPVLGPWIAQELLGIFDIAVIVAVLCGVFALGVDIGAADLHGAELVAPDAPVDDLLLAFRRIQEPGLAFLDGGNRQRPFLLAD